MNVKKYLYIAVGVLLILLILAVALSADFSFTNITSDPYGFIVKFFELWAPAVGAVGTLIVAVVIILVLNYIRRSQEREKEQSIYALHDEIDINLSVILPLRHRIDKTLEPYGTEIRLGLSAQDRDLLFEDIDTTVFDNMKNAGYLRWLDSIRMEVVSCYNLIKRYNRDQSFQESHPALLSKIQTQLQRAQRDLEDTFSFLPHYTRDKRNRVKYRVEEELVLTR
jgi:hypothetical protein